MNATIKRIIVSIIQLDTDIKAGDLERVAKFINKFKSLYENLLDRYKYTESEFIKEIKEVIDYIFTESEIIDIASKEYVQKGELVKMNGLTLEVFYPLVKKIYEIRDKYNINQPSTMVFKQGYEDSPLAVFVAKYQSILLNYKPKPVIDTLEKACKGSAEYKSIKGWFIKNHLCDPVTFNWLKTKKGGKSILINYLKDLHDKEYTEKLKQAEIVIIAKNSFNFDMEIGIVKRPKGNDPRLPEIPHFKN